MLKRVMISDREEQMIFGSNIILNNFREQLFQIFKQFWVASQGILDGFWVIVKSHADYKFVLQTV